MSETVPVSEIFGPTLQGEGPSAGRPAWFVRLGGCNLTCRLCDTPYTWDTSRYNLRHELTPMTAAEIVHRLPSAGLIVISGGEPLLYQDQPAMIRLIEALSYRHEVEVETNGTRAPGRHLVDRGGIAFNVSPKLDGPMSVDPEDKRIVPAALRVFTGLARQHRARFKFVIAGPDDVAAVTAIVNRFAIPRHSVWCMPEGRTAQATLDTARRVVDAVLEARYNLTLRQHLLLWPDTERGR